MGYELTRFIGVIDEELLCPICKLVLENPSHTPCDHYFCHKCIEHWLSINAVCPVDREPLTTASLRLPDRLMSNLLGKLEIKCDLRKLFQLVLSLVR